MKLKITFGILITLLTVSKSISQDNTKYIFKELEVMAQFDGGYPAFYQYIAKNLRYPDEARRYGIQGKVYVSFVIDETGDLVNDSVKVVDSPHESLSRETIRVIRESPNWTPGQVTRGGEYAKQRIILPVTFKLDDGKRKKRKKR